MTGFAVKVTVFPRQNGFEEGEMVTLTGRFGLTVIVTGAEVAGLLVMQTVKVEESIHVTTSPFNGK